MNPFLNTAVKAARKAGKTIMWGFDRPDLLKIEKKGHHDYVTDVDKKSEFDIIDTLQYAYPNHSILSEESGSHGESDYQWIIDPLDGTTNFIHGYPHFSLSIALQYKGKTQVGVIYDPVRDDLFTAARGEGAQLNGKRMRVSKQNQLSESLLGTGKPISQLSEEMINAYFNSFVELSKISLSIRRSGSSALDLAYIAAGMMDGYWKLGLKIWDMAAGILMIQEAGGFVTDFNGQDTFLDSGNVIASNPKIFKELFKTIQKNFNETRSL